MRESGFAGPREKAGHLRHVGHCVVLQRKVSAANESTSGGLEPRIARMCSDEIDADESLYAMRPYPSYPCHPWFDISLLWLVSCR